MEPVDEKERVRATRLCACETCLSAGLADAGPSSVLDRDARFPWRLEPTPASALTSVRVASPALPASFALLAPRRREFVLRGHFKDLVAINEKEFRDRSAARE